MTSRNKNEVKPVQVSVKEVRNWRRGYLIASIALMVASLVLTGVAVWLSIATWVVAGIVILVPASLCVGGAVSFFRDYKKSAWMKAFWEDDWK